MVCEEIVWRKMSKKKHKYKIVIKLNKIKKNMQCPHPTPNLPHPTILMAYNPSVGTLKLTKGKKR